MENNIKIFTDNIEEEAKEQIDILLEQEAFKDCKIRIMPDVHAGKGCTIGTTMTITDKVVPNMVGVDIGCGMYTVALGKVDIDFEKFDYVLDCCDTVTTKFLLIKKCNEYNVKLISSMGTGNRLDPTKIVIKDIWKTNNDPLAKAMRKILRDNGIKAKIPVVTSDELPIKTGVREVGSVVFVPNVAGFCMASWLFSDIIDK